MSDLLLACLLDTWSMLPAKGRPLVPQVNKTRLVRMCQMCQQHIAAYVALPCRHMGLATSAYHMGQLWKASLLGTLVASSAANP